jgi:hypothetical protein
MKHSTPYRCLECSREGACGLHGILVFAGGKAPLCKHNEPPGKPCHKEPVRMVEAKR